MKVIDFKVGDRILRGTIRSENKLNDKYWMATSVDGRHYLIEDSEIVREDGTNEEVCQQEQAVQESPKRKRG